MSSVGIVLGLTAALSWGLADYFAAVASRRAGSFRVVLGFHLVAVVLLALLARSEPGRRSRTSAAATWPGSLFLGLLGALSYLCFYRALAIGPISIVSPIVSAYAAATVVCAVVIGGERLGAGEAAGDRGRDLRRAARVLRPRPVQGPRTDCAPRDPPGTRHRGRDRRVRLRDRLLQCDLRVARPDLPRPGVFDALPSRRFASRRRMALSRPLAEASRRDFADRGRRHSRIRRVQLRRPARGYDRRRDRRGAVLGRSDRFRRRAPARAPALGAMGRYRRS